MNREQAQETVKKLLEMDKPKYIRFKARMHKIRIVAVQEPTDHFYAASLDCCCEKEGKHKSCPVLTTAYIFPTDMEAIAFGKEWLQEICMGKA